MNSSAIDWPDEADEVIRGDLTAAAAYVTPAGGAVVISVCTMGIGRREAGEVGFTTSLGFATKLERIIADPHVALAYHTREHGFSASSVFVLAQGLASVDLRPSRSRLVAMVPQGGILWDSSCAVRCGTGCCTSRAGLLAHAYRPQLVGLATRTFTGWLEVADDGSAVYAPHTSKRLCRPATQETAAGVQWAVRQIRALAGPPPRHCHEAGTAGRAAGTPDGGHVIWSRSRPLSGP